MDARQELKDVLDTAQRLLAEGQGKPGSFQAFSGAAEAWDRACQITDGFANSAKGTDRVLGELYATYYRSKAGYSKSLYHHEAREPDKALLRNAEARRAIATCMERAKELLKAGVTEEGLDLDKWLASCEYDHLAMQVQEVSIEARRSWDKGDWVRSLELHKRAADLNYEVWGAARTQRLDPAFERMAKLNYLASISNVLSLRAKIISENAERKPLDSERSLVPVDDLARMIERAYEAHDIAKDASEEAPDIGQFRFHAQVAAEYVDTHLLGNLKLWPVFLLRWQGQPGLIARMRSLDARAFRKAAAENAFGENGKLRTLSALGSASLLLILAVGVVYLFVARGLPLLHLAIALGAVETVFLLLSAVFLRCTGLLSDTGFFEVIGLAMEHQTKMIREIAKRRSGESGTGPRSDEEA